MKEYCRIINGTVEVYKYNLSYQRRYNGKTINYNTLCVSNEELAEQKAYLDGLLIEYTQTDVIVPNEILALEGASVSSYEELQAMIDGTETDKQIIQRLQQELLDTQLAMTEMFEMMLGGAANG